MDATSNKSQKDSNSTEKINDKNLNQARLEPNPTKTSYQILLQQHMMNSLKIKEKPFY